jgi:hypothetical protein
MSNTDMYGSSMNWNYYTFNKAQSKQFESVGDYGRAYQGRSDADNAWSSLKGSGNSGHSQYTNHVKGAYAYQAYYGEAPPSGIQFDGKGGMKLRK